MLTVQHQQNNNMARVPNRIFVGGIPQNTSQTELRDYFSYFGGVKDARIITDSNGVSKGYGFVTYETEDDAQKALNMDESQLMFKDNKLNVGQAFRKDNQHQQNRSNFHQQHQQQQQQYYQPRSHYNQQQQQPQYYQQQQQPYQGHQPYHKKNFNNNGGGRVFQSFNNDKQQY